MKAWIKTSCYFKNEEEGYLPDLAGYETQVPLSLMKINFPTEVLVRVAGSPDVINAIVTAKGSLTDTEARTHIQNLHPNADLENVDTRDPEVDEIAKSEGLNPDEIRRDVQVPTRGKQVLQDQEQHIMAVVCEKIGLTRDYWDAEAKKIRNRGIDIEHSIKDGRSEEHEFVLSRIRNKKVATKQI